jgi:GntR family transcriptional repressor for pyruvate dehydrogenase complex
LPLEPGADLTVPEIYASGGRGRFAEAIEAREVIELAIVQLAALRRTDGDLDRLRASLAGMRENRSEPEAFAEFDFALHVALCDAARNHLLAGALANLRELMQEMIALFTRAAAAQNRLGDLVESHTRLVAAVEEQDEDAAARIISDMMILLRIEAGRPQASVADRVSTHRRPQIGMLETTSTDKGDRP